MSEHPWPGLEKAAARGEGVTLTAGQVVELLADYAAVVEKNNELLRAAYGAPIHAEVTA